MDFFEVVENRRSIRKYKSDEVPEEMLTKCLNAARLAPSSTNSQPWKFLVVRNKEKINEIVEAGYGQSCLKEAPVITIVMGDRSVYKKRLRRAKELNDIGAVSEDALEKVEQAYKEQEKSKDHKEAMENDRKKIFANCMIAAEHYVLAATAQGLATCWVMLIDNEKLNQIFKFTEDLFPVALITTGFPNEEQHLRPRYLLEDMVWDDEIGKSWKSS